MDSKRLEPATSKEESQDQLSLLNSYTVAIGQSINKDFKQIDIKIRRSGNGNGSGGGLSASLDTTFHKCGKKGHIRKDCRSKVNGSDGKPPKNYSNEIP